MESEEYRPGSDNPKAGEIMMAVDAGTGRLVIADISRDDAWITAAPTDALRLSEWA